MKRVAIGVDIGGTNVKLGLVDEKGKVLLHDTFLTQSHAGKKEMLDKLAEHVELLKREASRRRLKLAGLGIGAPGPIDVDRGFVYSFPNITGWENTPFKQILQKRLKMPVFVDNDANAMAWGEYRFGAGRGSKNMIGLTLGTGIGGGIVMNGRLFHGPHYSAAEMGHFIVEAGGTPCACGNRGCIEAYVGNGYFVREVRKGLAAGAKSILKKWIKEGRELSPKLVQEAASKGDRFAKAQWKRSGERLGSYLAGFVNVLDPERIVIGGGIALAGGLIFGPVRAEIKRKSFPIASRFVKVLPAVLGPDAGLIGAAALAFSTHD